MIGPWTGSLPRERRLTIAKFKVTFQDGSSEETIEAAEVRDVGETWIEFINLGGAQGSNDRVLVARFRAHDVKRVDRLTE
jgi:hypothetical protein